MSLKDVIVGLLKTIMTPLKNNVWGVLKLTCLTKSYQTKNKIFNFWGKYDRYRTIWKIKLINVIIYLIDLTRSYGEITLIFNVLEEIYCTFMKTDVLFSPN